MQIEQIIKIKQVPQNEVTYYEFERTSDCIRFLLQVFENQVGIRDEGVDEGVFEDIDRGTSIPFKDDDELMALFTSNQFGDHQVFDASEERRTDEQIEEAEYNALNAIKYRQ